MPFVEDLLLPHQANRSSEMYVHRGLPEGRGVEGEYSPSIKRAELRERSFYLLVEGEE